MGIVQIPAAVAGATRNIVSFTSSQTWTVPSTAKYVDVLVVGGGCGGRGGHRNTDNNDNGGSGGAVTIMRDIYLNGTGTVSIVVGSGSSGTTGTATTTQATQPSNAGYSGFGTYVYSQGGTYTQGGLPGYKGTSTASNRTNSELSTTQSDFAPAMSYVYAQGWNNLDTTFNTLRFGVYVGLNSYGLTGGRGRPGGDGNTAVNACGTHPGSAGNQLQPPTLITTNTIPQDNWSNVQASLGTATAGTAGTGGGAGGAAGILGVAGGGGGTSVTVGGAAGQGGAGAGGGGSRPNPTSGTGGNGGNAGTNTGAGGGNGAYTGSSTAGTGGNGGNGAAGIVIVSWIS
jgi:hypothetical protein